jgi:hypothetical protein
MIHNGSQSNLGIQPETTQYPVAMGEDKTARDISHVEQVLSHDDDLKKEDMDLSRVDKEVSIIPITTQQAYCIPPTNTELMTGPNVR